ASSVSRTRAPSRGRRRHCWRSTASRTRTSSGRRWSWWGKRARPLATPTQARSASAGILLFPLASASGLCGGGSRSLVEARRVELQRHPGQLPGLFQVAVGAGLVILLHQPGHLLLAGLRRLAARLGRLLLGGD